jgi:hypothetical protein
MQPGRRKRSPLFVFPNVQPQEGYGILLRLHDTRFDPAGYHTERDHRNYKNGILKEQLFTDQASSRM